MLGLWAIQTIHQITDDWYGMIMFRNRYKVQGLAASESHPAHNAVHVVVNRLESFRLLWRKVNAP